MNKFSGLSTSPGRIYDVVFGKPGQNDSRIGGIPELQVASPDIIGDGKELSRRQKFGHAIKKNDQRVWDGKRIVRTGTNPSDGSPLYRLIDPRNRPKSMTIRRSTAPPLKSVQKQQGLRGFRVLKLRLS